MKTTGTTRLFAVLGDPVTHTLSPRMHNAGFSAAGIDARYVAIRCGPSELGQVMHSLARAGGGGNVTIPHKRKAAHLVDRRSDTVAATGACNTFWLADGVVHGDNTDVEGFANAALTVLDTLAGIRALVLGAGGGAAAAVRALLDRGARGVTLLARSPERAQAIAAHQDPAGSVIGVAERPEAVFGRTFDLIVNATPLGLEPDDPAPLDLGSMGDVGAVVDMAYLPGGTAWARDAMARGVPACDGIVMLVEQGAAAFRDWFRREPPIDAMRAALEQG